jgi:DNA adenine methylase
MTECKLQKPFLKWVGGKTQIIHKIIDKFPAEIENYHELFLGGGSVLFALLSLQQQNKIVVKDTIYAYDINPILINVYKNIQTNKVNLFKYITHYITKYDSIQDLTLTSDLGIRARIKSGWPNTIHEAVASKESYYYWMRNKFNTMDKSTIECSALFMVINKTCFRGMYREGPDGFNIPFGNYKTTPTIITKEDLDTISDLIKDVVFVSSDFINSIQKIKEGDFVYLDPPYAPESEKSFVGYTADGFDLETHKKLFNEIKTLHEKEVTFVLSNAKVDLVVDTLNDFNCEEVKVRRAINSKKPGSTTTEVIIYN